MAEEHILPESAGNVAWVLPPGVVCDKCNHHFGTHLDTAFLKQPNVAFMRPFCVGETKKGKPPKAEFTDFSVHGASGDSPMQLIQHFETAGEADAAHRELQRSTRFDSETGKHLLPLRFTARFTLKERNEASRFLLKAGIEFMAFRALAGQLPRELVFDERFHWARKWVRQPPNKRTIIPFAATSLEPAPHLGLGLGRIDGRFIAVVIAYGSVFVVALEQVDPSFYESLGTGFRVVQTPKR